MSAMADRLRAFADELDTLADPNVLMDTIREQGAHIAAQDRKIAMLERSEAIVTQFNERLHRLLRLHGIDPTEEVT